MKTPDTSEESVQITGYSRNTFKSIICHLFSCLCFGFPYLIFYWKPHWKLKLTHSKVHQDESDSILLLDHDQFYVLSVQLKTIPINNQIPSGFLNILQRSDTSDTSRLLNEEIGFIKYFDHLEARFVWNSESNDFIKLTQNEFFRSHLSDINLGGISENEREIRRIFYGLNKTDVKVRSYGTLLLQEILHPFFVFQFLSILLWCIDEYYFYAGCIFLISAFSIGLSLVETRKQSVALRNMTTLNGIENKERDPTTLVPGDIIDIGDQNVLTCDAVLLSGSCFVNEAMLTGESLPVSKTEITHGDVVGYHREKHKGHTLFAGTKVLQAKRAENEETVKAVVVATGFSTARGELIRSILYPKPVNFKFYSDSIKFVIILFLMASIGMVYCVYVMRHRYLSTILIRCADIITVVVPPALPAAMTVGTFYAQNRLKKALIFCIAPQRINIGGKLKLICFDKTGTLTEDGLEYDGVTSANDLKSVLRSPQDYNKNILECMSSCHSLTRIDGELTGDPLDLKMFGSTGWILEDPDEGQDYLSPTIVRPEKGTLSTFGSPSAQFVTSEEALGIIRIFPFNSEVARMSVVVRNLNDSNFKLYLKGAPEKIFKLCHSFTIPKNFQSVLESFTLDGLRVIGLAYRDLPPEYSWHKVIKAKRNILEKDLTFLVFLLMRNSLKNETTPVINELRKAEIRCVMITGDNILTALSVSKECGILSPFESLYIVEPNSEDTASFKFVPASPTASDRIIDIKGSQKRFAMTGDTWSVLRTHRPDLIPRFVEKGIIFARMNPEQKAQLVTEIVKLDYIVGMVGDGANDCSALKAAHVGISLSEAEASVAAPFTSRIPNISCVPSVIKEGRCALVTSFGLFKYMALYSMIQFITVLTLYTFHSNLGDFQYLYIDLAITTTIAVFMSWTDPYGEIVPKRPSGSLISGSNLFSIFSQILICLLIQVGSLIYLRTKSWYSPITPDQLNDEGEAIVCWENTTLFFVSSFQYLILATVFSKGRPYRKPFYTNLYFLASLITLASFTLVLGLAPGILLSGIFQLKYDKTKSYYRITLLIFVGTNVILSSFVENILAESFLVKKISHKISGKKEPKNLFKRIRAEIEDENWPGEDIGDPKYLRSSGIS